jgi:hypothetical protein
LIFVGPMAQSGSRFRGMEEVVSSDLTRSTKTSGSPDYRLGYGINRCIHEHWNKHSGRDHVAGEWRDLNTSRKELSIESSPWLSL